MDFETTVRLHFDETVGPERFERAVDLELEGLMKDLKEAVLLEKNGMRVHRWIEFDQALGHHVLQSAYQCIRDGRWFDSPSLHVEIDVPPDLL